MLILKHPNNTLWMRGLTQSGSTDEMHPYQNKQTHAIRFVLPKHMHLMLADYPMDDNAIQMTAIAVVGDAAVFMWKVRRLLTLATTRCKTHDLMLVTRRNSK